MSDIQQNSEEVEEYISTDELARKKGLKARFIQMAVKKYGLPHYKFGRLLRFKESEFDQWAVQRRKVS